MVVLDEATRRGYCFDGACLARAAVGARIEVGSGQLDFEWQHLLAQVCRGDAA